MTIKTIMAASVLALAPTFALAECGWEKKMNASQCPEGQVLDAASGACVNQATS
ncbi:hypothetical protein EV663_10381 [Rhodovulum bhavnagarense]|uniref:Adenylosuccinate lyase n=1 Tax=Rhodovulum bhavnagarense TaxID=992286 RepID=A0A4V2SWE5_9RHOB|nr:hypothetical protein [Rhodovulum bhavnagarense]TCP61896.1 hypothetical protein EV663_10381 [Rhodovulum bhavnagarense]